MFQKSHRRVSIHGDSLSYIVRYRAFPNHALIGRHGFRLTLQPDSLMYSLEPLLELSSTQRSPPRLLLTSQLPLQLKLEQNKIIVISSMFLAKLSNDEYKEKAPGSEGGPGDNLFSVWRSSQLPTPMAHWKSLRT